MLMALGRFNFVIGDAIYQSIVEEIDVRHREINPIGGATRHHLAGRGVVTKTLEGVFYPLKHGGMASLEAFKARAGTGVGMIMMSGFGFHLGGWSVNHVSITNTYLLKGNAPQRVEFSVELLAV
ncbi:MAG: hypothetical protein COB24_12040 [Hyphomicrobiales bacterium]|nr:MAG: hypothetical protein COB24_12040 [Hyphomicrobiales bacterium]